nr:MAG TPA: hypothetical protein [Caudoviricetes sp.]
MNITKTTEPRPFGYAATAGTVTDYRDVPTTTYTATADTGEEVATLTVLEPSGVIIDATYLGSRLPGYGFSLIKLVQAVSAGRDLAIGEPDGDQAVLLNMIAGSEKLVDAVDLLTDEGMDAEIAATLASYKAA